MTDRLAIGVGCRRGTTAAAIVALVEETVRETIPSAEFRLYTVDSKADEAGLAEAAVRLQAPLLFLSREALAEVVTPTQSARVQAMFGTGSIAESAALAGAGEGAVLIIPRRARDGVTCAAARGRS